MSSDDQFFSAQAGQFLVGGGGVAGVFPGGGGGPASGSALAACLRNEFWAEMRRSVKNAQDPRDVTEFDVTDDSIEDRPLPAGMWDALAKVAAARGAR